MSAESPWHVRLAVTLAVSVAAHALVVQIVELLPGADPAAKPPEPIAIALVAPPEPPKPPAIGEPPPEPPKPEPPEPPEPPAPKVSAPKQPPPKVAPPARDVPPPPKPADSAPPDPNAPAAGTDEPVFGVAMESTSQGGAGPAVPTGNTLARGGGTRAPDATQAPAVGTGSGTAPVAAYEVTKMPLPRGSCAGKYTDEAKAAGIEGVVVLDLVVDARGRATEITVVQGLDHGLTAAAVAALAGCTFSPGEKNGVAVPVKVRGFKIRFVLDRP